MGALILAVGCEQPVAPGGEAPQPADLVLRGGRVVTVDPSIGEAGAVAVKGFRIEAVGDAASIEAHIGPETEIIELNGRLAIPGFIEGHGHYLDLGRAMQILDLTRASNWQDVVRQVADAARAAEPGAWIFGRGWHQEKWAEPPERHLDGMPLNDSLNTAAPHNPVYLTHASGHAAIANHSALEAAGIATDTPDPLGGVIVRAGNGRATGVLLENAQQPVADAAAQERHGLSRTEVEKRTRRWAELAAAEALRFGVTSFQDAGTPFAAIDLLRRLEAEGALPVRLYVMVQGESDMALKSDTLDNAFSAFEEHVKGSLTPGKYADIVVLSQDILTVPEEHIPATQVDYTIVAGKVRHARAEGRNLFVN